MKLWGARRGDPLRSRRRDLTRDMANESLVLTGLAELAAGALIGWAFALAKSDPERVRNLGIRSASRRRRWHLDPVALGGLCLVVGTGLPDLPRRVSRPLAPGCWTNASAFGLLAFGSEAEQPTACRAALGASPVAGRGVTSVAVTAFTRRRQGS